METNLTLNDEINFPYLETEILKFWKEIDAFKTSLKQSENRQKYTFYDGPPFATGLPHYGHILAGTIKDVVTRYAHQSGYHVDRRFGWDCHGVPIEHVIDKKLNISGPADVEKIGIAVYNDACRSIVSKYSKEWEQTVTRIGRWIDFENDYKTMYPWFMESVWYIFKMIYEKGLVYRGVKVMPFSTACSTPLSNFEAKQNFKDVNDPAVVVTFPLLNDKSVELLAWTTTPWTLPSNLALCVNPDFEYVKVFHEKSAKHYILLESRLSYVFKKDKVKIVEKMKGKSLENLEYESLFNYFSEMREKHGAFRILCDGYVTSDSGTGVVHQSPYFGEDDYRVCKTYNVIKKDSKVVCPVDECGKFTEEVTDFVGQYVKDADKEIMKYLKNINRLFSQGSENHNYPFCWRSDTPLLYKAVNSWFIRVESVVENLIESNSNTYWVPDFVKNNRFGNWLKDARDWSISRNRYWGTPIPLWISEDGEEIVCVGSIDELEQLSGIRATDLHRENIDNIEIPSKTGRGILKRIPEVFDCWFESGSMPYAQMHYPFSTSEEQFREIFPADFIAEGIDQTRGWFYTLTVIGTILFGKSPFKNIIVNGIVKASDNQKMSKRLNNYPDPVEVVDKYGADALRLYLINSPVVRAQDLRFNESGVRDVLKDVFLPWYNACKFLINSSLIPMERKLNNGKPIMFKANEPPSNITNTMDKWIISFTQSLLQFFHQQMNEYHLDTVIPRLVKYIELLTNWYVRMNRKRLRGETVISEQDWKNAVHTLFFVLYQITLLMAPFVPFITEHLYQKLRLRLEYKDESVNRDSVHYLMLPKPAESMIDIEVEKSMALMQTIVETGRKIRDQEKLALKAPLMEAVVVADDIEQIKREIVSVECYVKEELNVRKLTFTTDKKTYGVQLKAELNHRDLGRRLKKDFQNVLKESKNLSSEVLEKFLEVGELEICGYKLNKDDIQVVVDTGDSSSKYKSMSDGEGLLVLLDTSRNQELIDETIARELVNRIQRRRKELQLIPEDPVTIFCNSENGQDNLQRVLVDNASTRAVVDRVVQQPIELLTVSEKRPDVATCSILNDTKGSISEVKLDNDEVFNINLWFSHDHSRLQANNRCCSKLDNNNVTADTSKCKIPKMNNSSSKHFQVVNSFTGEVLVSLSEDSDISWEKLERYTRIALGWCDVNDNLLVFRNADNQLVDRNDVKKPLNSMTYYYTK